MVARRRRDGHHHHHEAFHLSVELLDFDHHAAHLLVCSRSGGGGGSLGSPQGSAAPREEPAPPVSSLLQGLGLNATGMAILEVGLLSGFALAPDGIRTDGVVRKVEAPPGKVVVYLDSVRGRSHRF